MNKLNIKKRFQKMTWIYSVYKKIRRQITHHNRNKMLHQNGYVVLDELTQLLFDAKFNSFIAYGTLLGFIREKGLLGHDDDLDFVILDTEDFSWESLEKILYKNGYNKIRYFTNNDIITEETFQKNGLEIDFFRYFFEEDHCFGVGYKRFVGVNYSNDDERTTYKCTFPVIPDIEIQKINGHAVPIPSNYEALLECWYGEDWKTPKKSNYDRNEYTLYDYYGLAHVCNERG